MYSTYSISVQHNINVDTAFSMVAINHRQKNTGSSSGVMQMSFVFSKHEMCPDQRDQRDRSFENTSSYIC